MKIFFDSNKFIWEVTSDSNLSNSTYNSAIVSNELPLIMDYIYYLPLYIYDEENEECILITDEIDYQIDSKIWERYLLKLSDEIKSQLLILDDDALKDLYDNSPSYKKQVIWNEFHYYYGNKVSQFDQHLAIEFMCRFYAEVMYIERVAQRSLTTDETTAFHNILTMIHNQNSMLKNNPFDPNESVFGIDKWYVSVMDIMLDTADTLRSEMGPRRYYIFGI